MVSKAQNQKRRSIENAVNACGTRLHWRMTPLVRYSPAEQAVQVLTPTDGDGSRAQGVFEHQSPTDNPRDKLTHGRVGIGISAAGDRNHRRKLGITETRECTTDGSYDEGQGYRRPRSLGGSRRGAHEQSGTNDGADAESYQALCS